ncbi:MAG: hypothetical protein LBD30_03595 [Verrucomicrobiales bacterium]|jgi:hypothetical protein|nr:hypothetical protein [Verrucomicrobiales bacterium]
MKKPTIKAWFKIAVVAALTLTGAISSQSQILWDNPVTISGTPDIDLNGTIVKAYNIGERYDVTFPDIYFADFQTNTVDNYLSITSPASIGQASSFDNGSWKGAPPYQAPFDTLDSSDYGFLFRGGIYAQANQPLTVTLSNLTPGVEYQVQVWINDSRNYGNTRNAILSSAGGMDSAPVNYNQGSTNTLGNYIIGTFVANSTGIEIFNISSSAGGQINALVLSVIPEPSAWLLSVSGLVILAGCSLFKHKKISA